jgi:hypothetical protein
MSALGHKQTSRDVRVTSALPPITVIRRMSWHVRLVPKADIVDVIQCVQGPIPCRRTSIAALRNVPLRSTLISQPGEKGGDFNMSSKKDRPLDELTFKACQQALKSALAVARQWYRETDPQLKAKLALQIFRDATTGEVNPAELQRRALEGYFLRRENRLPH